MFVFDRPSLPNCHSFYKLKSKNVFWLFTIGWNVNNNAYWNIVHFSPRSPWVLFCCKNVILQFCKWKSSFAKIFSSSSFYQNIYILDKVPSRTTRRKSKIHLEKSDKREILIYGVSGQLKKNYLDCKRLRFSQEKMTIDNAFRKLM